MKKIFTLVAVALCAISTNAQTEKMSVMDEAVKAKIEAAIANPSDNSNPNFIEVPQEEQVFPEGTYPNNIDAVTGGHTITMKDYIWEYSTDNITVKAVSTPNLDAAATESWQTKGNGNNESLSIEGGVEGFTQYVCPKNGNPSLAYKDFYDYNSDQNPTHRVAEKIWTLGCGALPVKGCYYEFTAKTDGTLTAGIWLNKNLAQKTLFVIDETATALPYTDIKLKGFRQNNTYEKNELGETVGGFKDFTLNENYLINLESDTNRPFFGLATFDIVAGKKYLMFSSNSQLGFFGYLFTLKTGINSIANTAEKSVKGYYTLDGAKVNAPVNGITIVKYSDGTAKKVIK